LPPGRRLLALRERFLHSIQVSIYAPACGRIYRSFAVTWRQSHTICVTRAAKRPVRRREHQLKTDFKAASVLERLGQSLSDADLDYQAGEGIHEFIVRLGGMRHVVDFTDDLMEKKNEKDLSVVILGIVERASTQSLPVHFMVRNDNFEKVMQALKH
jgi:hypothetical protein